MAIRQLFKRLFADADLSKAEDVKDTRVFSEILAAVQTAARISEVKVVSSHTNQMIWVAREDSAYCTYGAPGVIGAPIFQLTILENGAVSVFRGPYGPTYTVQHQEIEMILSEIRNYHLYM